MDVHVARPVWLCLFCCSILYEQRLGVAILSLVTTQNQTEATSAEPSGLCTPTDSELCTHARRDRKDNCVQSFTSRASYTHVRRLDTRDTEMNGVKVAMHVHTF